MGSRYLSKTALFRPKTVSLRCHRFVTAEALPEPLPRYRKPCQNPCPATRSLARTLAPLPEALPETLPRYPKHCCCCCWRWCCCWLEPSLSEDRQMFTWNPPSLQQSKSSSEDLPERSPSKQNHAKNQRDIRAKTHAKRCKKNMSCQNREGVTGRGRENGPLFPHP